MSLRTVTQTEVMRTAPRAGKRAQRVPGWKRALRRDWQLYSLAVLPVVFLLLFKYVPMLGNVVAFRSYTPGGSMFGDEWVGFEYFEAVFSDAMFWRAFANTVIIGGVTLICVFPLPIILALLLNEVRLRWFKQLVQTVSYLPHFMSIVIIASFVKELTSLDGTINAIVQAFGGDPVNWLQEPDYFRAIYVISEAWQTVGWGTILYLAALTTIDEGLYEAAKIDGANRLQQTWHVTLPGIRPTMMVLLILNIGQFMAVGFEKILLLYNPLTTETAEVLSTYVYTIGIKSGVPSYATAIGLFEAVIGLVLVVSANAISRKMTGASLW